MTEHIEHTSSLQVPAPCMESCPNVRDGSTHIDRHDAIDDVIIMARVDDTSNPETVLDTLEEHGFAIDDETTASIDSREAFLEVLDSFQTISDECREEAVTDVEGCALDCPGPLRLEGPSPEDGSQPIAAFVCRSLRMQPGTDTERVVVIRP